MAANSRGTGYVVSARSARKDRGLEQNEMHLTFKWITDVGEGGHDRSVAAELTLGL